MQNSLSLIVKIKNWSFVCGDNQTWINISIYSNSPIQLKNNIIQCVIVSNDSHKSMIWIKIFYPDSKVPVGQR